MATKKKKAKAKSKAKPQHVAAPFSADLKELAALVECSRRKKRDAAIDGVRSSLDGAIATDVDAFLGWYAEYTIREIGLWRLATAAEMLGGAKKAALPHFDPAAIAAATGTLFLGKDGSGRGSLSNAILRDRRSSFTTLVLGSSHFFVTRFDPLSR